MAQTGYTPILIYSSSTASNTPLAANLTNSTLGSELAINIADGKLFYKDGGGAVQVIGWKVVPTSAGGTGLTSYTAGDTLYYSAGSTLSKLGIGSSGYYMSSSGTAPQWSAPAALTAANDTNVTLTVGGSASTALLNAASVTAGWTGLLSIARGGTNSNATPTAGGVGYGTGAAHAYSAAGTSGQALLSGGAGSPTWGTLGTGAGGTGLTSFTSGGVLYASSSSALATSSNFTFDGVKATLSNSVPGTSLLISCATSTAQISNFTIQNDASAPLYFGVFGSTAGSVGALGANTAFIQASNAAGLTLMANNAAGAIIFASGSTAESARISSAGNYTPKTAGTGINFTANTPAAGKTSQLLNWYEEGTFTPTLTTDGTNFTSVTYAIQVGTYTRIGRQVTVSISIRTNGITVGSASGNLCVGGLPFTSSNRQNTTPYLVNLPVSQNFNTANPTHVTMYGGWNYVAFQLNNANTYASYTYANTGASPANTAFFTFTYIVD